MNPQAMELFGNALMAFFRGNLDATLIIHRDDGYEDVLPVSHFFRSASEFSQIENAALERCCGHILDVGAGTGLHSLVLQKRGEKTTPIDVAPEIVDLMRQRGVKRVECADIFELQKQRFDTIMMMGHGIGLVETIDGLDRFLTDAKDLLTEDGQVLLDSVDVRATTDPVHLAYQEANRRRGQYIGEIRVSFEFEGRKGPVSGWLHVDPDTLKERATHLNWECEIALREKTGEYLAKLTKQHDH